MNKVITTALAAALMASVAANALAQEDWRGRGSPEARHRPTAAAEAQGAPEPQAAAPSYSGPPQSGSTYNPAVRRGRGNWPGEAPTPPQPPQARQAPAPPPAPPAPPSAGVRRDDDRRGDDRRRDDDRRGDRYGDRWNDHDRNRDPRWNNGDRWGGSDYRWRDDRDWSRPRYDRRHYPPVYRAPGRYRVAPYYPPRGWYDHSWGYGDLLPRGWLGLDYVITDWWAYGLPMPPIGYEWIRVGDDAVLVDTFTGRVVQVAPSLFW